MTTGNFAMTTWGINAIRNGTQFTRVISALIIITFGGLVTSPAVAATRAEIERQERIAPREQSLVESNSEKLNAVLLRVKDELGAVADGTAGTARLAANVEQRQQAREILKDLRTQLRDLDKAAREDFRRIGQDLEAKQLPEVILERHADAVAKYEAEADALLNDLDAMETADDVKAVEHAAKAFERLEKIKLERSHKPFDPEKMPFGTPDNKVRKPAMSAEEFAALGLEPQQGFLAASAALTAGVGFGLDDSTNPLYLAATPDAQITLAIQQLADELDRNPVKIYNWVHNNIEFMPTYGSIQGSQLTLDNRKGNAFDTASLTIALLRASGVPARYVYGTVEIPVEQVMNWVGGVTNPMAAGNLLGQGGIPNTALASGGEIKAFRLEHVWVEAWVDFHPSRGAVNRQGDSWMPMDASFKQYEYTNGVDIQQAVPFDAEGFAQEVFDSATVNEAEGWVQGVDQMLIQTRMEQYRGQIEAFIEAQDPDTTVGDVTGTISIIRQNWPTLSGTLPMKEVVIGARYSELPDAKRLKFQYVLHDRYGSELLRFQRNTVDVAGKRIALSFRPATDTDESVILSYLLEASADGSEIYIDEVQDSVPGYLVDLTAEFVVEGEVVQAGENITMGTELNSTQGYYFPGEGWNLSASNVVAGEYHAIGLNLAGIAASQLNAIRGELGTVQSKLESNDPTGITRHSLTGNLLQAGVQSYFALNDTQNQLVATSTRNIITSRLPSFGTFSTSLQTSYLYGMPRDVELAGVLMDISFMYTQVADKANLQQNAVNYMRAAGTRSSALEHLVPEMLFNTEENPANGISAAKAIVIAHGEGQRFYNIKVENLEGALAVISADPLIEGEIRNAVLAGKEVSIHQDAISYNSWLGHGYIVTDPETGSGAYKISGGKNGGYVPAEGRYLVLIGLSILAPLAFLSALGPIGWLVIFFVVKSFLSHLDALTEISKLEYPSQRIQALKNLLFISAIGSLNRFSLLKNFLGAGAKGEAWALWLIVESVVAAAELFIP